MYPRSLIPALPTFYKYVLFENSSIHGKEIHFVLGDLNTFSISLFFKGFLKKLVIMITHSLKLKRSAWVFCLLFHTAWQKVFIFEKVLSRNS